MKKKDIWISLAIIAASAALVYYNRQFEGYIEIDAGAATATLQIRNGLFGSTTVSSDAGPTKVRATIHRPRRVDLFMEQDGQTWQISGSGQRTNSSKIKVKNNETTTLRLGPPFLIKPSIYNNGSVIAINFAIIGQSGEQYQAYALKNNRVASEAKVKIIDEVGKVLTSGKFQYG